MQTNSSSTHIANERVVNLSSQISDVVSDESISDEESVNFVVSGGKGKSKSKSRSRSRSESGSESGSGSASTMGTASLIASGDMFTILSQLMTTTDGTNRNIATVLSIIAEELKMIRDVVLRMYPPPLNEDGVVEVELHKEEAV